MSVSKTSLRSNLMIVSLIISAFLTIPPIARPSSLDPSFGIGGITTTQFTNAEDRISSIQLQPDGKIVVSGYSYSYDGWDETDWATSAFIARYFANGSLDPSFGQGGKVVSREFGRMIALASDGKVVTMGMKWLNTQGGAGFTVARLNPNGSQDDFFAVGGQAWTTFGSGWEEPISMIVQPDGKIVVSGIIGSNFGLVRYNVDGFLDLAFGNGGRVVTRVDTVNGEYSVPGAMVLQPNGSIVVVGSRNSYAGPSMVLVRYLSNGSLDPAFGLNGVVATIPELGPATMSCAVQSDGKIVVSGSSYYTDEGTPTLIARFDTDGSLDRSFATNGVYKAETRVFGGMAIALQPDGKIVGVGKVSMTTPIQLVNTWGFVAIRLHQNGSPDDRFGPNGRRETLVDGTDNAAFAVAVQPDGKILSAGGRIDKTGLGPATILRYGDRGRRAN